MRIFYALTFTNEEKEKIKQYRQLVEKQCDKGRFSRPENFHITLQFIGQIDPSQLEEYKKVLKKLSLFPKILTINKFGTFEKKNKKIIWLGVEKNDELEKLQQQVVEKTKALGVEEKFETYTPHMTLGRQVVGLNDVNTFDIKPFELKVNAVALMESTRINNVLTYVPLDEIYV